jgi:hypothetical protein
MPSGPDFFIASLDSEEVAMNAAYGAHLASRLALIVQLEAALIVQLEAGMAANIVAQDIETAGIAAHRAERAASNARRCQYNAELQELEANDARLQEKAAALRRIIADCDAESEEDAQ